MTCATQAEAKAALNTAKKILEKLGVTLQAEKTRIVHVRQGFEFLGFKIKRKSQSLKLAPERIRSGVATGSLYAYPREKSLEHFKEEVRQRTRRKAPLSTEELIKELNGAFRLVRWILRRLWSQRCKRWRNTGWKILPEARVYGEMGLVNLVSLIPTITRAKGRNLVKA